VESEESQLYKAGKENAEAGALGTTGLKKKKP
jgi:hypothetical protein